MNTRKAFAAAALAAVLGSAAAATPATAQQRSAGPAIPRVSYHLIWSGTHAPTHYWPTPDFVPRRTTWLATNYGCYGHDGARIRAEIVRTRDRQVVRRGHYNFCDNGRQYRLDAAVRQGTSYYLRLYLKGPEHSMYAKAYEVR